jgi:hypothetical protein
MYADATTLSKEVRIKEKKKRDEAKREAVIKKREPLIGGRVAAGRGRSVHLLSLVSLPRSRPPSPSPPPPLLLLTACSASRRVVCLSAYTLYHLARTKRFESMPSKGQPLPPRPPPTSSPASAEQRLSRRCGSLHVYNLWPRRRIGKGTRRRCIYLACRLPGITYGRRSPKMSKIASAPTPRRARNSDGPAINPSRPSF